MRIKAKKGKAIQMNHTLINKEREYRAFTFKFITDKRDNGDVPKISGHAAVFDQLSLDLGFFREKITPGAFSDTLNADVRALFNHNPDFVLGRTGNDTLKLSEDSIGLKMEIIPPDTFWARDLITSIERGDIDQASFGFNVLKQSWEEDIEKDEIIRTLEKVELVDVSVVTFPAFPQTDVQIRAIERHYQECFNCEIDLLRAGNQSFKNLNRKKYLELLDREV